MIKKKKKKFPFLNTDNNKKIDLNHKRKLSYRYRNRELQNTKIDVEKNHSRKLREKIRGRRNQT